ncbi:Pectate trisaccharide-lyase [Diplonema papillatum]|nr:Pectate trisaccharide-lyase [Diplonema papillatum]
MSVALALFAAAAAAATPTGYAALGAGTTGGAGGDSVTVTTGTELLAAICSRAARDSPRTIYVTETIDRCNTHVADAKQAGSSCTLSPGVLSVEGVENLSIVGLCDSHVEQIGIYVKSATNIILQNLDMSDAPLDACNRGAGIAVDAGVKNLWIDHVSISSMTEDEVPGLIDIRAGTSLITISYSAFETSTRDTCAVRTVADSLTLHHSSFTAVVGCGVAASAGKTHVYNNYFASIDNVGVNVRLTSLVRIDYNVFESVTNPFGAISVATAGKWDLYGNSFIDVAWVGEGSCNTLGGPIMKSTGSLSLPYTADMDHVDCLVPVVEATSGVHEMLLRSNFTCAAPERTDPPSTSCSTVVPKWGPCRYSPTCCASGTQCYEQNEYYAQCRPSCKNEPNWTCKVLTQPPPTDGPATTECSQWVAKYGPCLNAPSCCTTGTKCYEKDRYYAQCLTSCSGNGWSCNVLTAAAAPPPSPPSPPACARIVKEWGNCLHTPSCCTSGTKCYKQHQWYAQCRRSCSESNWSCKVLGA